MRNSFIQAITELAEKNKQLFLLTGDLGYNTIEDFVARHPKQFLNAGISEQNMIGVATGLAMEGKIVFVYSIANFPILRPMEQVRNDVCYHNANVKIISVGSGFTYGPLGSTHHGTEDLAAMRALPNMTVIAPADKIEARAAAQAIVKWPGPCYIRIAKSNEAHTAPIKNFRIGKALTLKEGKDITLIGIGSMVVVAMNAARALMKKNISARVLSMHTLKPLDTEAIKDAAKNTKGIITIEEHSVIGGLGSAVAETLVDSKAYTPLKRMGIPDTFADTIGDQEFLQKRYGLTEENIITQTLRLLK